MTRKDYVKIAEDIRTAFHDTKCGADLLAANAEAFETLLDCVESNLASTFANDNPRFDRARFAKACGAIS